MGYRNHPVCDETIIATKKITTDIIIIIIINLELKSRIVINSPVQTVIHAV